MTIRAKFKCETVTDTDWGTSSIREIKFHAVYSDSGENKDFSDSTPSGELTMQISKGTLAYDQFKAGKDYYLDFNEVVAEVEVTA